LVSGRVVEDEPAVGAGFQAPPRIRPDRVNDDRDELAGGTSLRLGDVSDPSRTIVGNGDLRGRRQTQQPRVQRFGLEAVLDEAAESVPEVSELIELAPPRRDKVGQSGVPRSAVCHKRG
jgi:hypothetical protein